jgi:hypothetical protein
VLLPLLAHPDNNKEKPRIIAIKHVAKRFTYLSLLFLELLLKLKMSDAIFSLETPSPSCHFYSVFLLPPHLPARISLLMSQATPLSSLAVFPLPNAISLVHPATTRAPDPSSFNNASASSFVSGTA